MALLSGELFGLPAHLGLKGHIQVIHDLTFQWLPALLLYLAQGAFIGITVLDHRQQLQVVINACAEGKGSGTGGTMQSANNSGLTPIGGSATNVGGGVTHAVSHSGRHPHSSSWHRFQFLANDDAHGLHVLGVLAFSS